MIVTSCISWGLLLFIFILFCSVLSCFECFDSQSCPWNKYEQNDDSDNCKATVNGISSHPYPVSFFLDFTIIMPIVIPSSQFCSIVYTKQNYYKHFIAEVEVRLAILFVELSEKGYYVITVLHLYSPFSTSITP